ncbi:hypothetical protein, partial [Burkholderia sp. Tr-860]|uniref:hypothetical protein n=2 Tax=unclassified Burkholderia TaxID=2613784 RepID=UPI0019632200
APPEAPGSAAAAAMPSVAGLARSEIPIIDSPVLFLLPETSAPALTVRPPAADLRHGPLRACGHG